MTNRLTRSEVPEHKTWDLTDLFTSHDAWEKELEAIQNDVKKIIQYKDQLGANAHTLYNCLSDLEAFEERIIKASTYASLQANADGSDPNNQRDSAKIAAIIAKINADLSFIE